MSESKYRSNVGIVAVAILILFVASSFGAEPASGYSRGDVASTSPATIDTGATGELVGRVPVEPPSSSGDLQVSTPDPDRRPGGLKVVGPEPDFQFEATPIAVGEKLTLGGARHGFISNCFVDFNEDAVLQILPYQAIHTVVEWPYWGEYCEGLPDIAMTVKPIGAEHYHLNYVDKDLRWCSDLGTFGRPIDPENVGSSCSEIDPLSEPREAIQPHQLGYGVRVYAYNTDTGDRVPFTMNQIRVVSGTSEICFVRTDLPWIAAGPTDQPAGYCGELGVGNWDVSATVTDAYEVRIYSRSPDNSFSDIGLATY